MHRKYFRLIFALCAALSLAAVLLPEPWHRGIKAAFLAWTAPAQNSASSVRAGILSVAGGFRRLFAAVDERGEIERSREEIRRLRELLIVEKSNQMDKENAIAGLAAFDRFSRETFGRRLAIIPARVIGRDITNHPGVITIDKGTADGVRLDAGVVWGRSAVGVVSVAGASASQVSLLTSPTCKIPACIQRTGESTMVEGDFGDVVRMRHVFREQVVPGDICLTSGELGTFPRNVIIGQVTQANYRPGAIFQEIEIRPQLNLSALLVVVVLAGEEAQ